MDGCISFRIRFSEEVYCAYQLDNANLKMEINSEYSPENIFSVKFDNCDKRLATVTVPFLLIEQNELLKYVLKICLPNNTEEVLHVFTYDAYNFRCFSYGVHNKRDNYDIAFKFSEYNEPCYMKLQFSLTKEIRSLFPKYSNGVELDVKLKPNSCQQYNGKLSINGCYACLVVNTECNPEVEGLFGTLSRANKINVVLANACNPKVLFSFQVCKTPVSYDDGENSYTATNFVAKMDASCEYCYCFQVPLG